MIAANTSIAATITSTTSITNTMSSTGAVVAVPTTVPVAVSTTTNSNSNSNSDSHSNSNDNSNKTSAMSSTGAVPTTVPTTVPVAVSTTTNGNSNDNGNSNKTMSTMTDHRYGPIHDDESDDEIDRRKGSSTQLDANGNDVNANGDTNAHRNKSYASIEVDLAAQSRANTSILRATDYDEDDDSEDSDAGADVDARNKDYNKTDKPCDEEEDLEEPLSVQAFNDALEYESLLFSVRRTSARDRLLKLISCLKLLSAKLERRDEVKEILKKMATPNKQDQGDLNGIVNSNVNSTSNVLGFKRGINHDEQTPVNPNPKKRSRPNDDSNNASQTPICSKFQPNGLTSTAATTTAAIVTAPATTATISNTIANTNILTNVAAPTNTQTIICMPALTESPGSTSPTPTLLPYPTCLNPRSHPPVLKPRSIWVQLHQRGSGLHCPDFNASNSCPVGSACPRRHVYQPVKSNNRPMTKELFSLRKTKSANQVDLQAWYSKADLERAYDKYRKITLTKESFSDKIKPDELNVAYYTCCFTCPVDEIVYYAQPFPGDTFVNGNKSSQGIWWYMNMKDAREALATQVIRDLQARNIVPDSFFPDLTSEEDQQLAKKNQCAKANAMLRSTIIPPPAPVAPLQTANSILPSALPDINPWNWAELVYKARCALFSQPQGCPHGVNCQLAHVHIPKTVTTDRFPPRDCLPIAYQEHLQVQLKDPFFMSSKQARHVRGQARHLFHVKTLIDNRNQIWYTSAWTCPYDKTIYYAAGGLNGRANSQGFVLYPSVEEAKLAVAGVVLNSFIARGMSGSWTQRFK
jgi:hypothetical protein